MHYKQIKKDTPEAFKKLKKWINAETKDILQFELMMILKNERELYDFFDDMGIFVFIPPPILTWWGWEIYVDDRCVDSADIEYDNRKEAEKEAFKRAFNQLEKQCK